MLIVLSLLLCASACGNGASLTDDEMSKLAPPLQQLVQGEDPSSLPGLDTSTREGETVYAVMLRVSDAEAVREAGIPLNSVMGSVATARLTIEQIKTSARLSSVSRVEPSGRSTPHPR
ncbi:hypothetical protein CRI94_15675 [Longibacter salinarum]|uniref:Uncharacterized protein n=2 Tax=Longibacter salinarum TaxID=1850348 RepID=A0A2A8CUP2_9BACT|nr:hypothetical protein CRI94_15675 [Longibacter salinarum]